MSDALQTRLAMQPYNEQTAALFVVSHSDDWLRRKQGLALPAIPPTTSEARRYFFVKIREYAAAASANGHGKPDYEAFAREWNQSANGKDRYYVTTEVLSAYAKTWEKFNNVRASREIASDKMNLASQSRDIFAAPHVPLPEFLTGTAVSIQPQKGVIDTDPAQHIPPSISIELPISRGAILQPVADVTTLPVPQVPGTLAGADVHNSVLDM
jgi:hypothetical protein